MTISQPIGLDLACERLSRALWTQVGQGRPWSIEALSAASGIPDTTLKAYRRGDASPGLSNLLTLFAILGPEFANQVLALSGLGGARRFGEDADSLALNARAAALTALIAQHMVDGLIDHREVREQVVPVRRLHVACGAFLARHDGAPQ